MENEPKVEDHFIDLLNLYDRDVFEGK